MKAITLFAVLMLAPGLAAAAGYVKLGDIKGESKDAASSAEQTIQQRQDRIQRETRGTRDSQKGKVEATWKVEKGEK